MAGPYGFFKDVKIRCNYCMDVIKPNNDTEWVTCSCGQSAVRGINFLSAKGDNLTDISQYDYDALPATKEIDLPTKEI